MGRHRLLRDASSADARQLLQNAALPVVLLLVVVLVAALSPLRDQLALSSADPAPERSQDVGPSTEPEPEPEPVRIRKRPATHFTLEQTVVPGATFTRERAPRPGPTVRPERPRAQKPEPEPQPEPLIPAGFVEVPRADLVPTQFTVSSYNVLGYGHTAKGGNKPGWADGRTRMRWATAQLRGHGVSVVGLQEFQIQQFQTFTAVAGGEYAVFPGGPHRGEVQNSIAWRRADWSLVESHLIDIPYFNGSRMPMPYILLEHARTGRRVWFSNFHNPASVKGPAEGARDRATNMEIELVNRLRASTGHPVVITGDMNEREEYLCRVAARAGMHSANGGYVADGRCHKPPQIRIDWILGTSEFSFSNYVADRSRFVARTSDHPLLVADASIAAPYSSDECLEKSASSPYVYCPPS